METIKVYKGDTLLESFNKVDPDNDELDMAVNTIEFTVYTHYNCPEIFKISSDPTDDNYSERYIKQSQVDRAVFALFADQEFTHTLEAGLYYYKLILYGPNDYVETFNTGIFTVL